MRYIPVLIAVNFLLFVVFIVAITWNTIRINENFDRIDHIEELYNRTKDRWHKKDHDDFVQELKRFNPSLILP